MKIPKDNWLVKTSHSYFSLVQKFLFVSVGLIIYRLSEIIIKNSASFDVKQIDVFNLLGYYKTVRTKGDYSLLVFITLLNLAMLVVYYFVFIKLIRFLKNVLENNPFTKENGKYLKTIGLMVVGLSYFQNAVRELSKPISSYAIETSVWIVYAKLTALILYLFDPFLMAGVFLLVIGEIVIRAAVIKQENDLTV